VSDQPLTPFTRQRIARLAEGVLERSGAVGALPTPMKAVQDTVGVAERIDVRDLPAELAAKKPPAWKRILGAVLFKERVVFIDTAEPEERQLFTDAHETTHLLCEWHEASLRLDGEETLFRDMTEQIEAEANYGASCLIFQGSRFHQRALHEQVSIRTPLALAHLYGASRHSTLHYYVEEHPEAVALLVAGRFPHADGTLPIWRSVESQQFLRRFGRLRAHLPGGKLPVLHEHGSPLAEIVNASRVAVDPPNTVVALHEAAGSVGTPFVAEAYFNGRCHFVLLTERRARRLGRRARAVG
jgi:hypothetical protein